MRWEGRRESENIEDQRGHSIPVGGLGGRGGGPLNLLLMAYRVFGFKGVAVAVVGLGAYGLFSGGMEGMLGQFGLQSQVATQQRQPIRQSAAEKELVRFVSVVLADTEETWHQIFQRGGKTYKEPRLVLFRGAVKSACGMAGAATGPFYCPGDQKVYIDLSFYNDLKSRYKAPGDFAQAYVIAHEVGHHVQTLLGISEKVHAARKKLDTKAANRLSVKQELQADCLAGIWAHHADRSRQLLESGDIEEGLTAASAIGDDRLQKQSRGYVTPDSFTHGSSAQRVKWFKAGFKSGKLKDCDTFSVATR